jgi:hypothetical protein
MHRFSQNLDPAAVGVSRPPCLGPAVPLHFKDEEAQQCLLLFWQTNLLRQPKLLAPRKLFINGYLPPVGIQARESLTHCPGRQCVAVRAWSVHSHRAGHQVLVDIPTPGTARSMVHSCRRLKPAWFWRLNPPRRLQRSFKRYVSSHSSRPLFDLATALCSLLCRLLLSHPRSL